VGPAGKFERVGPAADPGEEMALPKRSKIIGVEVEDAALIDGSGGKMSGVDEVAEPSGAIGIVVIVIRSHSVRGALARDRRPDALGEPVRAAGVGGFEVRQLVRPRNGGADQRREREAGEQG